MLDRGNSYCPQIGLFRYRTNYALSDPSDRYHGAEIGPLDTRIGGNTMTCLAIVGSSRVR
jgi:hypothetical protein